MGNSVGNISRDSRPVSWADDADLHTADVFAETVIMELQLGLKIVRSTEGILQKVQGCRDELEAIYKNVPGGVRPAMLQALNNIQAAHLGRGREMWIQSAESFSIER